MEVGAAWALIWVASIVLMVMLASIGEFAVGKEFTGVMSFLAIAAFLVSTIACVWIASGLHISIGAS